MGKKNKNKKGKKKGKQNKNQNGSNNHNKTSEGFEDDGQKLNLSLDFTEEFKSNTINKSHDNDVPDIEPSYESTEKKAREDMEQCEKLLGVQDEIEKPIEEIQLRVEEERQRAKSTLKDKEYEENKKLSRKQKKNQKEVDSIFYSK